MRESNPAGNFFAENCDAALAFLACIFLEFGVASLQLSLPRSNLHPTFMKLLFRTCAFLVVLSICVEAQWQNPTKYPYGGVPYRHLMLKWEKAPIDFKETATFNDAIFDSTAYFRKAKFGGRVYFRGARFGLTADFYRATFQGEAYFSEAIFDRTADFGEAKFLSTARPELVFENEANFSVAIFSGTASFWKTIFGKTANFGGATFLGTANFGGATFDSTANFSSATFHSWAGFEEAQSGEYIDFENAQLHDGLSLGSHRAFKIDLSLSLLSPETKIVLAGFVQLKMPVHKFGKLSLLDSLSYTLKQQIIENLKEKSYTGNREAAFELDYILSKSTMYQEKTDEPDEWYYVWRWPKWVLAWFYDVTMGLGYRPFRIVWWGIGIMVLGAIFFFLKMEQRVNAYVATTFKQEEKKASFDTFETFLNCAYFSVMLFFTFRLKGQILTFFDSREKKFIMAEWALGLSVYIAFLYHTSAVLQNIRSLFLGG